MFGMIKEVEAMELAGWLDNGESGIRIIDVREMPEIAQGVVPGAQAMPLATLPVRLSELRADEKLVMVCRSGARSAQACIFLKQQGYENVYNLRGGMMGWASNRLPVIAHQSS